MIPFPYQAAGAGMVQQGEPSSPTAHRYWRVNITANDGSASFYGFTEIEMRGSIGGANLLSPQTTNAAATSSSQTNNSNAAWRGADANTTTSGWLSNGIGVPAWWRYDFGNASHTGATTADVRQIAIYGSFNAPTASPKDFTLQWSDDGTAWTTVLTVTGQTGWTGAGDVRTFNVP